MATIEELAAKVAELEQQMAAITAPPTEYYTSAYSGEEIDAAVKKVSEGLAGGVSSFNDRTGAVMPQSGDYNATQIPVSGEPEAGSVAAALSNKAPAGFGWGDSESLTFSTDEEFKTYFETNILEKSSRNIVTASIYIADVYGYRMQMFATSNTGNLTGGARVFCMAMDGTTFSRCIDESGDWQPWEYVNPPMRIGVEYQTIERYNGKPVYMKLVDCGAGPNNTRKTVSANTQNVETPISCTGTFGNGTIPYEWFAGDSLGAQAITCTFGGQEINIAATVDYSSWTVFVMLKYTKTTD